MIFNFVNLRTLIFLILAVTLVGCSSNKKDNYKGMTAAQIYAAGQKNLKKENYAKAVQDFEALEARYPYGEFSDKAQLDLIQAYHKKNEPAMATAAADRFIRMNPRHPRADYALYLKGIVSYDQNMTFMYRHLPIDRSARDSSPAQESFDTFKELIERFPSSSYTAEARQRMTYLRDQLARHELTVVDYYMKRGAYLSAANRANFVIKNFEHTAAIPDALRAMSEAYRKLGMHELANDADRVLQQNFKQ